jgi:hypothetical protein
MLSVAGGTGASPEIKIANPKSATARLLAAYKSNGDLPY